MKDYKMTEPKWIKTSEKMPPIGEWVIVTTGDRQKTAEIKCYMGKRDRKVAQYKGGEWHDYIEIYDAWTSGHGDISGTNPAAWQPLPEPYKEGNEK